MLQDLPAHPAQEQGPRARQVRRLSRYAGPLGTRTLKTRTPKTITRAAFLQRRRYTNALTLYQHTGGRRAGKRQRYDRPRAVDRTGSGGGTSTPHVMLMEVAMVRLTRISRCRPPPSPAAGRRAHVPGRRAHLRPCTARGQDRHARSHSHSHSHLGSGRADAAGTGHDDEDTTTRAAAPHLHPHPAHSTLTPQTSYPRPHTVPRTSRPRPTPYAGRTRSDARAGHASPKPEAAVRHLPHAARRLTHPPSFRARAPGALHDPRRTPRTSSVERRGVPKLEDGRAHTQPSTRRPRPHSRTP